MPNMATEYSIWPLINSLFEPARYMWTWIVISLWSRNHAFNCLMAVASGGVFAFFWILCFFLCSLCVVQISRSLRSSCHSTIKRSLGWCGWEQWWRLNQRNYDWTRKQGEDKTMKQTSRLNVLRVKVCCRSLLGNWAFNLHLTSCDRISSTNTCQHFLVTLLLSQKCFPRNQDDFQRFQHCQYCCAARCGNLSALPWRK